MVRNLVRTHHSFLNILEEFMTFKLKTILAVAAVAIATQAAAQITFYEHDNYQGRSFTTQRNIANFERFGFNDRASSVIVMNNRVEVCDDFRFGGQCTVLRPGRYPSFSAMGINDRVSSIRIVSNNSRFDEDRYAPPTYPVYDNRRRGGEGLYEATVTSVRAVLGSPTQRCWVEREQVVQDTGGSNAGAVIAGTLLGGILGHQVGGGRGKDLATVGGAIAGATIGSNLGSNGGGQQVVTQNVQRCTTTPAQTRPEYWDVTYSFRNIEHRIQMTTPPGRTISVNRAGEPRS
jgi:uncharacterized protein YcfJ